MFNNHGIRAKIHSKKGANVRVLAGDDKGQTGRVLQVLRKEYRAIVEGINVVSKSTKPYAQFPNGGFVKKEAPVHLSNLALVENGKAVRVGSRLNASGKRVRYSKKTGEEIK